MALRDPFAAYNAGSNIEAHLVCDLLNYAGIQAKVIEDVSHAGLGLMGTLAEIHKPQVWIERSDIERARIILTEYETQVALRREANLAGAPIEVCCEECGKTTKFPAAQNGSVQDCPHCGAYVDVGDESDWDGASSDEWQRG